MEQWIDVREAARILGVSRQAVHGLCVRGTLPFVFKSGRRFFRRDDVVALRSSSAFRLRSRAVTGATLIEVEQDERSSAE